MRSHLARRVSPALLLLAVSLGLVACDSGGTQPDSDPPPDPNVEVTGTVTTAAAAPVEGASVEVLRPESGNTLATASTDSSGSYEATFTVDESDVPDQVQIAVSAEGFMDKEVSVSFQPTISRDVALEAASVEVSASGTVTDKGAGDPIEGATVTGTCPDTGKQLFETTITSDGSY